MNCQQIRERMMDVLYGEEVEARRCFEFFEHLDGCPDCRKEYLELLQTRELLARWELPEGELERGETFSPLRFLPGWISWRGLARAAAGILMALGVLWILQAGGFWPDRRVLVSEQQLVEMVNDVVVARQAEDWRIIGAALLELKEEMERRRRVEMQVFYDDLQALEQRYVAALEENNRHVRALLSR